MYSIKQQLKLSVSGRSMVEMLGVLAVVGVLTTSAISGMKLVMNRYKATTILNEVGLAYARLRTRRPGQAVPKYKVKNETSWSISAYRTADLNNFVVVEGIPKDICEILLTYKNEGELGAIYQGGNTSSSSLPELVTCSDNQTMVFGFSSNGGSGTTPVDPTDPDPNPNPNPNPSDPCSGITPTATCGIFSDQMDSNGCLIKTVKECVDGSTYCSGGSCVPCPVTQQACEDETDANGCQVKKKVVCQTGSTYCSGGSCVACPEPTEDCRDTATDKYDSNGCMTTKKVTCTSSQVCEKFAWTCMDCPTPTESCAISADQYDMNGCVSKKKITCDSSKVCDTSTGQCKTEEKCGNTDETCDATCTTTCSVSGVYGYTCTKGECTCNVPSTYAFAHGICPNGYCSYLGTAGYIMCPTQDVVYYSDTTTYTNSSPEEISKIIGTCKAVTFYYIGGDVLEPKNGDNRNARLFCRGNYEGNGYFNSCYPAGTMITLADGQCKKVEDVTYDDDLLVWDFDNACFAVAKPLWLKIKETTNRYNVLKFSDGSELRTIDQHRIFNKQAGKFTYPMTDETPIGTITFNDKGQEVTLIDKYVEQGEVDFYNIITEYHMNCFANHILTSCRFNNLYPIANMKFVKDDRQPVPMSAYPKVPEKWFKGLRLAEQPTQINRGNDVAHAASIQDHVLNVYIRKDKAHQAVL